MYSQEEQQRVIAACAKDPLFFGKIVAPQYFSKKFASFHAAMIDEVNNRPANCKMVILEVPRGYAKALALDTPIVTPTGWTTMGEIKVGDTIFDECGMPCRVTLTTDVQLNHKCYAVKFSDGEEIVADAGHLWQVKDRYSDKEFHVLKTSEMVDRVVLSTKRGWTERRYSIPIAKPLNTKEVELPVDPYVLGVWLGDGDSNGATLTCDDKDFELIENLENVGCPVEKKNQKQRYSMGKTRGNGIGSMKNSLRAKLRSLGVINNKHIPKIYLRSSVLQRMSLLQGLMDTDGTIDKRGMGCNIISKKGQLPIDVRELLTSLGIKSTVTEKFVVLNGKRCGPYCFISFSTHSDIPVFRLSRKLNRMIAAPKTKPICKSRFIIDVSPVDSVPVRCIQVDSPSSLYLAGRGMIPTHNTLIISTLNPLHRAIFSNQGKQKVKFIVIASFSCDRANLIIGDFKNIISGENFQGIFPGTEFLTKREDFIEVENKDLGFKFAIMARGRNSQVAGMRYEETRPQIFIGDDLESPDESYNQLIVDGNERFVNEVVQYGLDSDVGYSILIGTPFAFDCTTQRFSRYPRGVRTIRYPGLVSDTIGMTADEMSRRLGVPVGGSIWEDKFPTVDVEKQRDDAVANGTIEHFMRQIMLDPKSEGAIRIPLEKMHRIPKEKLPELKKQPMNVYILADYAYSRQIWADESAYVVVGIDEESNYYILDSDCGKWGDGGTTDKIIDKVIEYKAQLRQVGVETKGMAYIERRIMEIKREKNLSFGLVELKTNNRPKPMRIKSTISLFDDGRVFIVDGQRKFESQASRFRGEEMKHGDDIIDAWAHVTDDGFISKPQTQKTKEEELKEKTHVFFEKWAKNQPAWIKENEKKQVNRRVYHAGMRPNYF